MSGEDSIWIITVTLLALAIMTNIYENRFRRYHLPSRAGCASMYKNVDVDSWIDHAEENLKILKGNVAHAISKAKSGTEKLLWKRLGNDLEEIDVAQLPYNHPLCSGILDAESKPISDMPESLRNIFEQDTKKKYTLPSNDVVSRTCDDFFQEVNIRTKVSLPSTFDPPFGEWIEPSEEIEMLIKRFLEAFIRRQVWFSPKYRSYVLNQTIINEGSYVCEVLAPLFNIAFRDLPVNNKSWTIWGDMASWPDAVQKGDSCSACRPDFMLVAYVNNERVDILNMETGRPNSHKRKQEQDRLKLARLSKNLMDYTKTHLKQFIKKGILSNLLSIFSINVAGDDLRVYSMNMEYGILKNCLLTRATIPLHMVSTETIYPLIHSLLTLRTAIICTLQKLIAYLEKNKAENSDVSDEKTAKTILPPKRRKSNINLNQQKSKK
ncbi:16400_t:CDS:2 [Rhizophagus irregularis]|nr:16400_t:CDS:2 [Rhizophagus irregularis]